MDRQSRGQCPRDRFEPRIRGERDEGTRAVGDHGESRGGRGVGKILEVVAPKRGSDDRAGEGLAKARGTPFVGGHVDVCPVGGISRVGFREARELTGKLPSRPGGFAPAHHARSHHRESVGDVGHSLRVDDDSCARTNRAERDAEALGHARDDTVCRGQKVRTDLNPTTGHRSRFNATTRSRARLVDLDVLTAPSERVSACKSRDPCSDHQGFHDAILATHASVP